ncbi:hypothetical protein ACIBCB_37565 [Streptomyces uncialis]|uniref:hypothetical protein n=1 Tax=Streptomyces uncialis TaxID=1048205 RepID=UPI002F909BB1|nr:hypothetical protein OG268_37100 [Streptomyces uncialis]
MDSTDDLQPPCDCGALGDHPAAMECFSLPVVEIEVSGGRLACLEAIGLLRSNYRVDIKHRWQDPETGKLVFKLTADLVYVKPYIAPPTPTPEAAVLACLNDSIGVQISQYVIQALTGLDDQTLTDTLAALTAAGEIERVGPGEYRKDS